MPQPSTITTPPQAPLHPHAVEFYDTDADLVTSITRFLYPTPVEGADGTDDVAVVIADQAHRDGVAAALATAGHDVDGAIADGRLVMLDAVETLARIRLDDGTISEPALRAAMDEIFTPAARDGRTVRAYGEMVAVLWDQGSVRTAMQLEQLWNELAETWSFALFCGYPSTLIAHPGAARYFDEICQLHTNVVLAPSLVPAGNPQPGRGPERWVLPAALTSGAQARGRLRKLLGSWGLDAVMGPAELLTTELVNNAVVHAQSHVTIRIAQHEDLLRVEVSDRGRGAPRRRHSDVDATSGRGLMLVEAMSSDWGTHMHGDRKTVWFELPTDRPL